MIAEYFGNQNYDISIRFGTPLCQMKVDQHNCGQVAAKIARFNRVNSEIIGRKLTTFIYDVPHYCRCKRLLSNPLSNVRANSKGRS